MDWKKEIVNPAAHAELVAWTKKKIATWGRTAEYSYIATELRDDGPAYRQFPPYMTTLGLSKSERRNIAQFRIQGTAFVATHAQHRETELYGGRAHYQSRHCIWSGCRQHGARKLDDTAHVLLHCPLHNGARAALLDRVHTALFPHGVSLQDLGSDIERVRFLLGSPPGHIANALSGSTTAYRDVLRASAAFIKAVYTVRWVNGHQHNVHGGVPSV